MTNMKFFIGDTFFYRFLGFHDATWIVGKVTNILFGGTTIYFEVIKSSGNYSDTLISFEKYSPMYLDSKLVDNEDDSSILAMII